jgi:hypothetical protein
MDQRPTVLIASSGAKARLAKHRRRGRHALSHDSKRLRPLLTPSTGSALMSVVMMMISNKFYGMGFSCGCRPHLAAHILHGSADAASSNATYLVVVDFNLVLVLLGLANASELQPHSSKTLVTKTSDVMPPHGIILNTYNTRLQFQWFRRKCYELLKPL